MLPLMPLTLLSNQQAEYPYRDEATVRERAKILLGKMADGIDPPGGTAGGADSTPP
jgi:hypothetical protein